MERKSRSAELKSYSTISTELQGKGLNTFDMLAQMHANVIANDDPFLGTHRLATNAGFTDSAVTSVCYGMEKPYLSALRPYLQYWQGQQEGTKAGFDHHLSGALSYFRTEGEETLKLNGLSLRKFGNYVDYLVGLNPAVGVAELLLYSSIVQHKSEAPQAVTWYRDVFEQATRTHYMIDEFFHSFKQSGATPGSLDTFISEWKEEMQMINSASLQVATSIALTSLQSGQSVVPVALPVPLGNTLFKTAVAQVKDFAKNEYFTAHHPWLFEYSPKPERGVSIPLFLSAQDMTSFFMRNEFFWNRMKDGMQSQNVKLIKAPDDTHGARLQMGGAGMITMLPSMDRERTGVIGLQPLGSVMNDYSITLKDHHDHPVSTHVGTLSFASVLAYAQKLASQDKGYFSPCVSNFGDLGIGEQMALVARAGMHLAEETGLNEHEVPPNRSIHYFSQMRYETNFSQLILDLIKRTKSIAAQK